jgi:hypothetical protein
MVVVRQYYTWYMPKSAEVSSGRIIAVGVNYGKTVYVTAFEQKALYGTYIALGFAAISAIATYIATRSKATR